jgi:ABC-2 type transport system permease protein
VKKLYKLWLNENLKIYKRWRTWIMFILLFVLVVGGSILIKVSEDNYEEQYRGEHNSPPNVEGKATDRPVDDWKYNAQQELTYLKEELNERERVLAPEHKNYLENQVKLLEYRLANDIPPKTPEIWDKINGFTTFAFQLITLFVVVIAADIVASEFSWGTIKLLLIRSVSRTRILASKYLATLSFAVLLLISIFIMIFTISGILYGFEGFNSTMLTISQDGHVIEKSWFIKILQSYSLEFITLLIIVTIAFMISTVFRSSALAIGISLLTLFLGSTVSLIFARYDWIDYYLFTNIANIQNYMHSGYSLENISLSFSISVIFVYYAFFILLTWFIFKKRDITA